MLAAKLQRKSKVVEKGHVRVKRVALKDKGDVPLARRQMLDTLGVEKDLSGAGLFQAGDQPQDRRFAAAEGPSRTTKSPSGTSNERLFKDLIATEVFR